MSENEARLMEALDRLAGQESAGASAAAKVRVQEAFRSHHGRQRKRLHRWWTLGVAIAVCPILLAAVFPGTRVFAKRCVDTCVNQTSLAGHLLWASLNPSVRSSAGLIKEADRRAAPDFRLADEAGDFVRLADLRGKVVLLNFWATWCAPCRVEMPWFVRLQNDYGEDGFAALGISLDDDGWKSVAPYVAGTKINYPVMVSDGQVTERYGGVDSLPATFLIDQAGRIAMRHVGMEDEATLEGEIQALLAEGK